MTLRTLIAAAIVVAAPSVCAADSCQGSAQQSLYTLDLTAPKTQGQVTAKALLWISVRPPGIAYTDAGRALALVLGGQFGATFGQTYVRVRLDAYSAGLVPTDAEVMVYYPHSITAMPRVKLRGPFGVLEGEASRPGPEYNDVLAHFALTQAQAGALSPGTQLSLEVNADDGTLLESGAFDVADLATMKTLADAAVADFEKKCAAAH